MKNTDIDTMILGCTHYPLLRSSIMEYFGDAVHIVNPAYETAIDLKKQLEEKGLVNQSGKPATYEFYVSDAQRNSQNLQTVYCHMMWLQQSKSI